MTAIKSYTSLEQSRKLAEILPIDSADMEYMFLKKDNSMVSRVPFVKDGNAEPDGSYTLIPCWSLATLLNILPPIEGFRPILDLDINLVRYEGNYRDKLCFNGNNLIDTCVEMILKLKELNML